MWQVFLTLGLFVSYNTFSQPDKPTYYLIDGLSIDAYSKEDSTILARALDKFHATDSDTGRINALTLICDGMTHDDWKKFQFYQYDLIQLAMKSNPSGKELESLNYSLSGALVNLGYIHKLRGHIDTALNFYHQALDLQYKISDKERIALTLNNIGVIQKNQGNLPLALETYHKALKIQQELHDKLGIASSYFNIGSIYYSQDEDSLALNYFTKALEINKEIGSKKGISNVYNNIGVIYKDLGDLPKALDYLKKSLSIKKEIGDKRAIIDTYINIGNTYQSLGDHSAGYENYTHALQISEETKDADGIATSCINIAKYKLLNGDLEGKGGALGYAKRSLKISKDLGFAENIRDASEVLYRIYERLGMPEQSLEMHKLYIIMKDSISNLENQRALTMRQAQYVYDKQKALDNKEHEKQLAIEVEKKERQRLLFYASVIGLIFLLGFLLYATNRLMITRKQKQTIEEQKVKVDKAYLELGAEKEKSEELLLNILPGEVAEELKEKGSADARLIENVTIIFTDFKGFTAVTEQLTANQLVSEINRCFSAFDHIMEKHHVEKIKTIGDAYMAAGGVPVPNHSHATDVVHAALEIQKYIHDLAEEKKARNESYFEIRIGVHTGPVIAGIVGVKKFQYDIWGDTVNIASRMESSGEVGKINISAATYELIKDNPEFSFESRGEIDVKGKGKLQMYFVMRKEGAGLS